MYKITCKYQFTQNALSDDSDYLQSECVHRTNAVLLYSLSSFLYKISFDFSTFSALIITVRHTRTFQNLFGSFVKTRTLITFPFKWSFIRHVSIQNLVVPSLMHMHFSREMWFVCTLNCIFVYVTMAK